MEERKMPEKHEGYDKIATEVFLPIFPVIAKEALKEFGREEGKCLDIGCGGGMFGYFVAMLSDLQVDFLDIDPEAIDICKQRGIDWGLDDRCSYIISDVHDMSVIPDGSYDLIVSRGSIPFWGEDEQLVKAFAEIQRILADGGTAMIGGSLGPKRTREAISRRMKERMPQWKPPESRAGDCVSGYEQRAQMLKNGGINCTARDNDRGHWILIHK